MVINPFLRERNGFTKNCTPFGHYGNNTNISVISYVIIGIMATSPEGGRLARNKRKNSTLICLEPYVTPSLHTPSPNGDS